MSFDLRELKIWLACVLGLVGALGLTLLSLPTWLGWLSPEWLLVVGLYLVYAMPYRFNVGLAWVLGLLLDLIYRTPFGTHAFTMVLAAYFLITYNIKLKLLGYWQGILVIFGVLLGSQVVPELIQHASIGGLVFSKAAIGTLVWLGAGLFNHKQRFNFERFR